MLVRGRYNIRSDMSESPSRSCVTLLVILKGLQRDESSGCHLDDNTAANE